MSENDAHAVRWATSKNMFGLRYGKWHYTEDASFTLCRRPIMLANDNGSFLPEHDDIDAVDCKQCLRKLAKLKISKSS